MSVRQNLGCVTLTEIAGLEDRAPAESLCISRSFFTERDFPQLLDAHLAHVVLAQKLSENEPAKEIVSAVRHRDPDLKLSEIRESLARARRGSRCPS